MNMVFGGGMTRLGKIGLLAMRLISVDLHGPHKMKVNDVVYVIHFDGDYNSMSANKVGLVIENNNCYCFNRVQISEEDISGKLYEDCELVKIGEI